MKQISSGLTPFFKYILPWATIVFLLLGVILAFVAGQYYLVIVVLVIGAPIVGFMKAMLMSLKKVFLDKEHKLMIVKGSIDESIPYTDIVEILRPWTPPYLVTVELGKGYSFGRTFVFVPVGVALFWEDYDDELKDKIRR